MAPRGRLVGSYMLVAVAACLAMLFLRDRVLWVVLGALITGLVAGLIAARALVEPVRRLADGATRLVAGESFDTPMPEAAGDLGALGRALANLSAQLHGRMTDLRNERDRLSALLEAMDDGVFVVGRAGRVVLANPSAARLLGATGALSGRTVTEVLRHPHGRTALDDALRSGRSADIELEALAGAPPTLMLSVRPLLDQGACAVVHDVTHLRKLERVRRDFVSNVSHELRTPVASIQSYSETLLDGALNDAATARKFVEVIHRNASRIGRLVRDLLQLSQLEARHAEQVVHEPIDVHDLVEGVRDTVADRASAAAMTLEIDVPPGVQAIGDPDGVEQMILNLVDNALKYGKRGGTITVHAARDEESVELHISDDGPGIESRHLPRLFERFYRIDEGRSSDSGGTGLGLAIVKHLAESMGGSVAVESTLGKGSRFTIRLPAA